MWQHWLESVCAYLPGSQRQIPLWWGTWRTGPAVWTTSPPEPWEQISWCTMDTVVSVSLFSCCLCACLSVPSMFFMQIAPHRGLPPSRSGLREKEVREQTERCSYWSTENVTSKCSLPRSSMEGILDLWSLGITSTPQINGEHALELSFENLKQLLRTSTLSPAVCLLQNMGGNAKSIVLIYPCQNNLTSPKYQK